jgi:hypothetical protein
VHGSDSINQLSKSGGDIRWEMDPISKVLKKKGKEEKQSCKDVSEKTLWKRYFKK